MSKIDISVSNIEANKFNPNVMSEEEFESLKEGMKTTGQEHVLSIDPIIVCPKNVFYHDPKADAATYVIIDGEHRWQAAKDLGWHSIPCEIRNIGEPLAKAMNYRRNKERGNTDPIKEAALFQSEIDGGLTQEQIARKYNVSRPYVANRLGLSQLDTKVVEIYRKSRETFKKAMLEEYRKDIERWKENQEQPGYEWLSEPEEPTDEDFVPRGTISPSHLEPLATLPAEKQVEVATEILGRGWTVRQTEGQVKRIKADLAREKRFKEALKNAKRPKCPGCGGDPEDFAYDDETRFKCGSAGCFNRWEFMKTRKEVEAERAIEKTEANKEMVERMKEARENPGYIRRPEKPEELHEKVKPWLLRKVLQLTEIDRIQIRGKRGENIVEIDYQPPGEWQRMNLTFKIGEHTFGFNVQSKDYKKVDAKSRVDMDWNMKPGEKTRAALRRFFDEIVETDKDPELARDEY